MLQIADTLKYQSDEPVKSHHLYTCGSDPLILLQYVELIVFGKVRMNNVHMMPGKFQAFFANPVQFDIEEDGAILFQKVPMVTKQTPENVPCEPVPDMQDAMMEQMSMLFNRWAKERGLAVSEPLPDEEDEDFDIIAEDDFDMDFPLDDVPESDIPVIAESPEPTGNPEEDAVGSTNDGDVPEHEDKEEIDDNAR